MMIDTLITTKLFVPTPRPNLVQRPNLAKRLNEGLDLGHSLTLISAPAGYGKTTLLSEWLASRPGRIAWLSLDEQDNSAPRFWMHLITAIQRTPSVSNTAFGQTALRILEADQSASIQAILTTLLDDLTALSDTIVLVLDDYHVISNQAIHEGVAFLLGHQPRQLHLALATRVDPPLPISRLRARGQLTELRLADLRFSADEANAFLNHAMNLDLASPDVQTLEKRTEGWVVGLQLAALSLKGHPDRSARIRAFSGSHRHILDYLGEEVLSGLPEPVQQFLLKTSILENLCGSLCDALLNESSSQAVLEYLDQTNLFLIPLDEERNWYRYHHLFADALRARLRRKVGESEIVRLHGSVAHWCEENGFPIQAVSHALAAHDLERAARIVENNTLALMTRGELATLLSWIKLLPEALARERPWLCVEQGWTLAYGGQLDDAESFLRRAEQCEASQIGLDRLHGHIAAQRAYIALAVGQFARAFELANRADLILPQDEYWVRTVVEWTRGSVLRIQGNLTEAASAFAEHVRLARACDNVWALMMGAHDLATVYRIQGQLGRAAALIQDALDLARARGMANLGYLGRVETGLAAILYEQNKLQDARRLLLSSIEKNRLWQNPNHVVFSQAHLARVLLAQGDRQGAQASLEQAREMQRNAPIIPVLKTLLETTQVRLWISQGNRESVEHWVHSLESIPGAAAEIREQELLMRSRWLLAEDKAPEAGSILGELAETAAQSGRISLWIEIKMLQALAYAAIGDRAEAYRALEQALARGAPEGFVRVFLNEGEPLRRLLTDYQTQREGSAPHLHADVDRLLKDFAAENGGGESLLDQAQASPANIPPAERTGALQSGLLEPLSERELEVLQGLAGGLSYRDIADQLILAQGTVKVHVHNIYGKLNVANRTHAIARGRELGLL
jgi:LuxR family maltose regulon positive regulatory protein